MFARRSRLGHIDSLWFYVLPYEPLQVRNRGACSDEFARLLLLRIRYPNEEKAST